jgi:hypothetical protein
VVVASDCRSWVLIREQEDLTPESMIGILEALKRGEKPAPGPQNGRFSCEPLTGLTTLLTTPTGACMRGSKGGSETDPPSQRRADLAAARAGPGFKVRPDL